MRFSPHTIPRPPAGRLSMAAAARAGAGWVDGGWEKHSRSGQDLIWSPLTLWWPCVYFPVLERREPIPKGGGVGPTMSFTFREVFA
jgi:hypothetical protein